MDLMFEMYVIENDTSGVLIYCAQSAASRTDKSAGNMPDYYTGLFNDPFTCMGTSQLPAVYYI